MKRKRGLDLLGRCLVASEAPQDKAWLHGVFLQHFFTFFFFKGKGDSLLGLLTFKLKVCNPRKLLSLALEEEECEEVLKEDSVQPSLVLRRLRSNQAMA